MNVSTWSRWFQGLAVQQKRGQALSSSPRLQTHAFIYSSRRTASVSKLIFFVCLGWGFGFCLDQHLKQAQGQPPHAEGKGQAYPHPELLDINRGENRRCCAGREYISMELFFFTLNSNACSKNFIPNSIKHLPLYAAELLHKKRTF